MKLKYWIVIACVFVIILFSVGVLGKNKYIESAKMEAKELAEDIIKDKGEDVCYVWPVDYSMGAIEVFVESKTNSYYVVLSDVNSWVALTFLNLIISPNVIVESVEDTDLETRKCVNNKGSG